MNETIKLDEGAKALYDKLMEEIHDRLEELFPETREVVICAHQGTGAVWVLNNCETKAEAARIVRLGLEYLDEYSHD